MSKTTEQASLRRTAWQLLAWCCTGLGALGIFLPLLPTTPFLLLAGWAAARSSPRLYDWLYRHRQFGPILCAWRDEGAVPTSAKLAASITMLLSWIILWLLGSVAAVLIVTALMFSAVSLFIWSRPRPKRSLS